jgi:hypothetical protein
MTDDQLIEYLTENVNRKRREHDLSEVTEDEIRRGLDLISQIAETFSGSSDEPGK